MAATPIQLNDNEFKARVFESDLPVLVDFWAPWCGPCRAVAPVLEELAEDYAGRVVIAKVNTDHHQQEAFRLGVQGIPTMVLFKDGQEIDRMVGALPKEPLERWLDSALAN